MTIVKVSHIRAAGLCTKGARDWFASHDLSWNEFLDNGMSADLLDATGDSLAHTVTAIAREEAEHGRRG